VGPRGEEHARTGCSRSVHSGRFRRVGDTPVLPRGVALVHSSPAACHAMRLRYAVTAAARPCTRGARHLFDTYVNRKCVQPSGVAATIRRDEYLHHRHREPCRGARTPRADSRHRGQRSRGLRVRGGHRDGRGHDHHQRAARASRATRCHPCRPPSAPLRRRSRYPLGGSRHPHQPHHDRPPFVGLQSHPLRFGVEWVRRRPIP
jgi:hypothetical protein